MPKAPKTKFYAVQIGREGPKIYKSWDESKVNTDRWPGAIHKSFTSQKLAEDWLASAPARPSSASTSHQREQLKSDLPFKDATQTVSLENAHPLPIRLSDEQNKVLKRVKEGHSVFFTGSAGTGKSILLREIIRTVRSSPPNGDGSGIVGITASTGIAAVNIGGVTLHSWAGIGLGHATVEKLVGKIRGQEKCENVFRRWRETRTLIIDEISMIDGTLFDELEAMARLLRNNDKPFGGIQLVLCGDFCQLPPVPGTDAEGNQIPATFAFEAKSWTECVGHPIFLSKVFRQKEQEFVDMLNSLRFGQTTAKTLDAFKKLSRRVEYNDGIEPTELFPTRREVGRANELRLQSLPGPEHTYMSTDRPGVDSDGQQVSPVRTATLLERMVATRSIKLKVGAQVMLIKNLVQGDLVNGSVGQVIAFISFKNALKNRTKIATTDDKENGLQHIPEGIWPLVSFTNGRTVLVVPADFTVNNANGDTEAQRTQIPLILAWALSVHKSQGQTLERVKINLSRTFECGQAYVALSRATSMATLQVIDFRADKVKAHARVLKWHGVPVHNEDEYGEWAEFDNPDFLASYYD